jgi:serine/threonine protein kinase
MPRRQLSEFELGDQIGAGTVGTIFHARDRKGGPGVALKLLNPGVTNDPLVRQRFEREILILKRLRHPNIVAYFDSGETDGQLFYTMEFVEGRTLKDVLSSRGHLTWREATECGWQICSALQHAHNHGVIHRDLKPANLYLSKDGSVKLGDFGIALDLGASQITDHGMTVGSYMYMSPEQIRGEPVSALTDQYALGCLLYEMLTGAPPFIGSSFAQIFDQHLNSPIPSVREMAADCPEPIDTLVRLLLDKDPGGRPINAREAQGTLAQTCFDEHGINLREMFEERLGTAGVQELVVGDLHERDVSWGRLAMIAGLLALGITAAALLGR